MATENWRQYGGNRKQNQFHNLTIGTLVADQILLRESYAGKFKIPGSIYVGADVVTTGNVYSYTHTYTSYDNYVGKNLYLNKYLYFGTQNQVLDGDYSHAYMCGDFTANAIGINTQSPKSALDINGTSYTQTDILSVSSAAPTIRNTLGKNRNNRGITLNASDSNAILGFYIDTPLNYANNPNGQIKQTSGGNMYYISTNNNINSTNNTVLTANNSTYITSQTLTNITSTLSVTIATKNTNILSQLAISNRGQPTNIYNESTIIYDISNGLYLYDAYENSASKAGSALTLVATDNSSNTFLRLVTPNNAGLSITAGTYPNDQTRTISAFGISDNTGKYRVNQTIVTGSQSTKYYSTTGFNTYAPRTDNYVMDINGPTHISNGEINKMAEMDYEIFQTSFSKYIKTFGIAVGSASTAIYDSTRRIIVYPQYVNYTSDGGVTWTRVRVDITSDMEATPKTLCICTYDNNYAVIASSNSIFYYTVNGGKNWTPFEFNDPYYAQVTRNAINVYVGNNTFTGTKRVYIIYTLYGSLQMNMVYFDIDFNNPPFQNNITSFRTISNLNINTIYANDGYSSYVYFVGTGIIKYQTGSNTATLVNMIDPTTNVSQTLINSTKTYYGIACYSDSITGDTSYAVAVGVNIISYTYDGTNWTNITLTNTTLRSVYLYDRNMGMAVGDAGVFLYTSNGAQTWTIVPNSILNTSGYASRINGSYNKLRNVVMNDINTMSVTAVKQSYIENVVNRQIIVTSGQSKVYTCYIPNLYNRANNKVLDVSGNMAISGDINLNDGGNLTTNNSTFSLINSNASTVYFAGAASNIYIAAPNTGTTYVQNACDIRGDVAMHGSVKLERDFAISGNLQVGGTSYIGGDLSVNNRLYITNKAVFYSDIQVFGNVEHELDYKYLNRLYVEQDTYLYERVFVGGDASLNGNVYIGGPIVIPTLITPNSYTITLSSQTPIQSSQSLEVGTSVSYGSYFPTGTVITAISQIEPVFGHLVIGGIDQVTNLPVTGDILNGNTITLNNKPVGLSNSTTVSVSYQNSKIFSVFPDTSLNSRLYVGADTSLNGRLSVIGDVSLNSNLTMWNSQSYMTLNPTSIKYNYSSTNTATYNTLPLSQFQYIQTLTQSVQEALNTLTTKTNPITISNSRDVNLLSVNTNRSLSNDVSLSTIDPTLLGLTDTNITFTPDSTNLFQTNNNRDTTTLLTFDLGTNNILVAGNLIPTSASMINIGTASLPIESIYVYNQNALNFISSNQSQGALTFNTTTGYLDLSCNGLTGSTLLTYGGNVAIGKPLPNTTLDVLGTSIFTGDINQPIGNLYLTNRLYVGSDISLAGNMFSNKNLYQVGDATLRSRTFFLGDVSINSNLFILKDASLNTRLFVGGDTSLNSNLYVAKNIALIGDASINGRLNINSDVSLNSNLYVARQVFINNDLSLNGNITINGIAFLNNDEYLQGNSIVLGNQYIDGNVILNGITTNNSDVNMGARLYVSSDVSINNRLFVKNTANFNSDVFLNRNAYISNDLSLNGNISVGGTKVIISGDTSMNGDLFINNTLLVRGDTSLNGNLFINAKTINNSDVNMNNRLFIANDLSLAANLLVNRRIIANGDTSLNGNINIAGIIASTGDVSTNSRLFVTKDALLNSNLYVKGLSYLNNDVSVNGNLLANNTIIKSDAYINNNIIVIRDSSLNANLRVGGNTVVNGSTTLFGPLIVNNNINNYGSITTTGTSTTTGDVNVGSNLIVNQNTTLKGPLNVTGTTRMTGAVNMVGDLSVNGRLFVTNYPIGSIPLGAIYGGAGLGLGSFANDVNIGKNFYVGGDTTLYGNLTVVQDLTLIGQLVIKQYKVNQTITTVSYEVIIAEDLSLNGRLFMTGDASINGGLFISNDVSLNANLYVGGNTMFANPIIIGNSVDINGQFTQNAQSVFNADASMNARLFVFGASNFINDVSLNNRLFVQNDTSLNGNLFVNGQTVSQGDVSMNRRLYVLRDTSLNGNLFVRGQTVSQGDVSMNSRLYVLGDSSLNGNLFVRSQIISQGDASLNNRLYVQNDSNLLSRLIVQGQSILNNDVSMNYRLYVAKDVSMGSNLFVANQTVHGGDTSMNRRLYVQNDVSLNSKLYVANQTIQAGDVSMNSRLFVGSDASVNGNFYVGGKSIYQNDASFNKMLYGTDASYTGNVAIYGNLYLHTELKFDSLYVKEYVTCLGNAYITGQSTQMVDASLSGNLNVNMDSSFNGRLAIARDVSFNSNINVLLDSSLNRNLFVGGDSSLNSNLFVKGNTLTNGDVSMVSTLDLNGAMIARNNMNIYGIINQYNTVATPQNTIVNNTSAVTSTATQVTLGTSASQNVYVPGNMGIGTNNPLVPLYINKSTASTGQTAGYYHDNTMATLSAINTTAAYNYSIYALNSIATSDKLIATSSVYFSDERIKTDIENIDTVRALEQIRTIEPKKYKYIDSIGQGADPTWGFIAQEVKNVLDYSVSITKNFIPNIYEICFVENGNRITLNSKSTDLFVVGSILKAISTSHSEILLTVYEIVDSRTFIVQESILNDDMVCGQLFIYGQEISDFNNLDKNAIFTITTAALKQVDHELQATKSLVTEQQKRIDMLEEQIRSINDKLKIF